MKVLVVWMLIGYCGCAWSLRYACPSKAWCVPGENCKDSAVKANQETNAGPVKYVCGVVSTEGYVCCREDGVYNIPSDYSPTKRNWFYRRPNSTIIMGLVVIPWPGFDTFELSSFPRRKQPAICPSFSVCVPPAVCPSVAIRYIGSVLDNTVKKHICGHTWDTPSWACCSIHIFINAIYSALHTNAPVAPRKPVNFQNEVVKHSPPPIRDYSKSISVLAGPRYRDPSIKVVRKRRAISADDVKNGTASTNDIEVSSDTIITVPATTTFEGVNENTTEYENTTEHAGRSAYGDTSGCGKPVGEGLSAHTTTSYHTDLTSSGLAREGQYPWHVAILSVKSEYLCGGTIVWDRHVITVAHCIDMFTAADVRVRIGDYDLTGNTESYPSYDVELTSIVFHPNYTRASLKADLAVLVLRYPVLSLPNVARVCFPGEGAPTDWQECYVPGWGSVTPARKGSPRYTNFHPVLKESGFIIIESAQCQHQLRKAKALGTFFKLLPGVTCVKGLHQKDSCHGDGGSGLVCRTNAGEFVLKGLISWSVGCDRGLPTALVDASFYSGFILYVIRGLLFQASTSFNPAAGGTSSGFNLDPVFAGVGAGSQYYGSQQSASSSSQHSSSYSSSQQSAASSNAQQSSFVSAHQAGSGGAQQASSNFGNLQYQQSNIAGQNNQQTGGYGTAPQTGYGTAPQTGDYGTAPQTGDYGTAPQTGGYGTAPQTGYGTAPQTGGYGTKTGSYGTSGTYSATQTGQTSQGYSSTLHQTTGSSTGSHGSSKLFTHDRNRRPSKYHKDRYGKFDEHESYEDLNRYDGDSYERYDEHDRYTNYGDGYGNDNGYDVKDHYDKNYGYDSNDHYDQNYGYDRNNNDYGSDSYDRNDYHDESDGYDGNDRYDRSDRYDNDHYEDKNDGYDMNDYDRHGYDMNDYGGRNDYGYGNNGYDRYGDDMHHQSRGRPDYYKKDYLGDYKYDGYSYNKDGHSTYKYSDSDSSSKYESQKYGEHNEHTYDGLDDPYEKDDPYYEDGIYGVNDGYKDSHRQGGHHDKGKYESKEHYGSDDQYGHHDTGKYERKEHYDRDDQYESLGYGDSYGTSHGSGRYKPNGYRNGGDYEDHKYDSDVRKDYYEGFAGADDGYKGDHHEEGRYGQKYFHTFDDYLEQYDEDYHHKDKNRYRFDDYRKDRYHSKDRYDQNQFNYGSTTHGSKAGYHNLQDQYDQSSSNYGSTTHGSKAGYHNLQDRYDQSSSNYDNEHNAWHQKNEAQNPVHETWHEKHANTKGSVKDTLHETNTLHAKAGTTTYGEVEPHARQAEDQEGGDDEVEMSGSALGQSIVGYLKKKYMAKETK